MVIVCHVSRKKIKKYYSVTWKDATRREREVRIICETKRHWLCCLCEVHTHRRNERQFTWDCSDHRCYTDDALSSRYNDSFRWTRAKSTGFLFLISLLAAAHKKRERERVTMCGREAQKIQVWKSRTNIASQTYTQWNSDINDGYIWFTSISFFLSSSLTLLYWLCHCIRQMVRQVYTFNSSLSHTHRRAKWWSLQPLRKVIYLIDSHKENASSPAVTIELRKFVTFSGALSLCLTVMREKHKRMTIQRVDKRNGRKFVTWNMCAAHYKKITLNCTCMWMCAWMCGDVCTLSHEFTSKWLMRKLIWSRERPLAHTRSHSRVSSI